MHSTSYWLDTAGKFDPLVTPVAGTRFDVAVVGGGFTGLSSALQLAKTGASVAVFEAGQIIGEGSGRNGGQCNNGTLQEFSSLVKSCGSELAGRYYREFDAAVDSVETLVRENNIDCGFVRCGKVKLAAKPSHCKKLEKTFLALSREVDPDVRLLDANEVHAEVGSKKVFGGLLMPKSAQLHPGKFGVGLANLATAAGVSIAEHTPATALSKQADGSWLIDTASGQFSARQVLLAHGGSGKGTGRFSWFRRRVIAVGSFILVTQPLDTNLLDRLLPGRRSYVTSMNVGNYFRRIGDDRLLFGGRARFAVSNPKSDVKSGRVLAAALGDFFPDLAGAGVSNCWGGAVEMTADRLPRAGEQDGLYYAMGYSGHGVQMSVHMGRVMADLMQGRSVDCPWVGMQWPPVPGYSGAPWFLPAVGLYYRALDIVS